MEFRDLKAQYHKNKREIDNAIQKVINDTDFISGKTVFELEEQLAEYVGVKHCITCANGTEAMTLVMMAWDIKEGDAVFVPDFTFFSTGEIVLFRGATPVFVDVDRFTFNIDTVALEEAIIRTIKQGKLKPKAIIPVDLFGLPANFPEIEKIANKYNLLVLEDGAQGFGGNINGKKACSFGNIATTSFFPSKPLGCYGDGGAIFTNDNEVAQLLNSLKVHGKGDNKYDNIRIGVNSRLDTIQAAILKVKLKAFIDYELNYTSIVRKLYDERLGNYVEIPFIPDGFFSSYAQYTIKLKNKEQRDSLKKQLQINGVPCMVYYMKPMHKQVAFSNILIADVDYSVTNELCNIVLSLPMHPYLSLSDIDKVSQIVKSVCR